MALFVRKGGSRHAGQAALPQRNIQDLGMTQDFLEVIEERYHHKRALAISAQLPVKEWPSVFKDATIADAVLDRIVRNAYRFDLKGPSRRQTVEHMPADAGDDKSTQSEYTEN